MPPDSCRFPKANRTTPLTLSCPTSAIKIPTMPPIRPLMMLSPEILAMMLSPKNVMQKYSGGPKVCATRAMAGEAKRQISALTMPPKNEAYSAICSAFKDFPCNVMGYPSSVVAALAGVPGVLIKIAVMEPP